ncbi:hypothetical protein D9Q61_21960 [Salmonella enterica subsp. enterica serovar Enteritidis]|nr:hypothetical protein [Salmonella enterica subsp. enterica serovar Enteritidis]EDA2251871.1 hypothetical protein [Salmonella enterica subsp. enterica serovar Enteritidis]EDD6151584.1 hypothetical protein [Salmonella enterica subsp. enterica serovar Enteritidis]
MRILRRQVFKAAIEQYPEQKPDIAALLSFLGRINIMTPQELQDLFPEASLEEDGLTEIGFAGSFAGGNLIFKGRFNYPGQFVLTEEIQPAQVNENKTDG